jgi:homocysteine S-methyltransferase
VLSSLPVAVIGTNCTIGPQRMLVVAEDLVRYSAVPVSAQPNAGQPRRTGPRSFEFAIDGGYFSRYLTRFADAGVSLVGGCCGTTPTHIRAVADALRTQPPAAQSGEARAQARVAVPAPVRVEEPGGSLGSGSLADHLSSGRFVVAASITPPAAGYAGDAERMVAELADRGIGLVFVQPRENARTHMDSLSMALALQQRVGVETIATVTTWDKTIMSLQADLLGAHALGIRSVVSTTGSPPVLGDYPAVDGTWEVDSVGLAALLAGLNAGRDSNGLGLTSRTSFCIGGRINPAARDHAAELARAHAKIRAGAQFLVCRPVYELDALSRLTEALDGTGIPLLLSVAPLSSFEEADYLAHEVPGVTIPGSMLDAMERAGRSGGRAVGLELAANLLTKARPLVSGVILTAPGDDPATLAPLTEALG